MPDLFTHALAGYVVATVLSWRYERLTYPFVTLVMAGAILPDLSRIDLVIPAATIESTLGIPFTWGVLHQFGGTVLVVCLGALLAARGHRRAVFVLLALGAGSHYLLDALLYNPSGLTWPLLWPLTDARFAVDGFFLSTDRWPAAVATLVAAAVWYVDRTVASRHVDTRDESTAE